MHWFWRVVIAILAGAACLAPMAFVVEPVYAFLRPSMGSSWAKPVTILVIGLPAPLIAVALFWRLIAGQAHWDSETRCRKCGYILRGISEPRCPECGERI